LPARTRESSASSVSSIGVLKSQRWAFAHRPAYLGGDYDFIARSHLSEIPARDLLAQARGIDIRGVEEINSGVDGDLEMLPRVFLVQVPAARANGPIRQFAAAVAHAS